MLKLPIRAEGVGEYHLLSREGEKLVEGKVSYSVAESVVKSVNAYPVLVELMKKLVAGEAVSSEAKSFLAYLNEK